MARELQDVLNGTPRWLQETLGNATSQRGRQPRLPFAAQARLFAGT
jgi:hypothetical protein